MGSQRQADLSAARAVVYLSSLITYYHTAPVCGHKKRLILTQIIIEANKDIVPVPLCAELFDREMSAWW